MRIITLLARSGTEKYSHSISRLKTLFKNQLPGVRHELLVGDNQLSPNLHEFLPDGVELYGAPSQYWEFSIWSHLLSVIESRLEQYDLVNLATSAFENPPNEFLNHFSFETLQYAINKVCAIGNIDCRDGYYQLYGKDCSWWLRTGFFFIPPQFFRFVKSVCFISRNDKIFYDKEFQPFASGAPLSDEMKKFLLQWLTQTKESDSSSWYGSFNLTRATMPYFIGKCTAILNERMLTQKLRESGIPVADITWLARSLAQKNIPTYVPVWEEQRRELHNRKQVETYPENLDLSINILFTPLKSVCQNCFNKPRLLFIDDKIPTPDQDSGSQTCYGLIRIFVELGIYVDFIPFLQEKNPSYNHYLEELGVTITCTDKTCSIEDWIMHVGNEYDIIYVCRPQIAAFILPLTKKYAPNAKSIYQTVDLHFLRMRREAIIHAHSQDAANKTKLLEFNNIRTADMSIVLSRYEYNILKEAGLHHKVKVMPALFFSPHDKIPTWSERKDIAFIGGFAHTPNVDAVQYFCREIFPGLREVIPGIRFHIIGSNPPEAIKAFAREPGIVFHGYVRDLGDILPGVRITVAPLRYGAGIKGKIATSLSYGTPVIGTKAAVESMPNGKGTGVLGAASEKEFINLCVRLIMNEAEWSAESQGALATVYEEYSPERGKLRQIGILAEVAPSLPVFETWPFESWEDYQRSIPLTAVHIQKRLQAEADIAGSHLSNFTWDGFCAVCGKNVHFHMDAGSTPSGTPDINWRETVFCSSCGLNNRMRACLHYFYSRLRPDDNAFIYITEQVTPMYAVLKSRHPFLYGSEYMGEGITSGVIINSENIKGPVRHEDMTNLSFPDESFNYVLSFDVVEHVADEMQAFREICRILRKDGVFLFSAPFILSRPNKLIRAKLDETGNIIHLLPPEYHGNPVDPSGGALSFRAFGWDILNDLRAAGFDRARAELYWSRAYGYLGGIQVLFVAEKGACNERT